MGRNRPHKKYSVLKHLLELIERLVGRDSHRFVEKPDWNRTTRVHLNCVDNTNCICPDGGHQPGGLRCCDTHEIFTLLIGKWVALNKNVQSFSLWVFLLFQAEYHFAVV